MFIMYSIKIAVSSLDLSSLYTVFTNWKIYVYNILYYISLVYVGMYVYMAMFYLHTQNGFIIPV